MFRTHDEKTMRSSEVNFKVSIQDKGHFESLQRKIINIKGEDKLIILTRAADIVQLVIYNPKNNSIEDSKAFNGYWTSAPYNEEGSYKSISIASASINQEDCLIFVALYRDSATDTTLKSCVCWYNYASKNFGWSAANINDNLAYILNDPVYYHNILLSVKSSSEKNKILMTIPQNDGIHIYELDLNTKPFSWNHSSSYLPPIESLLSVQTTYTLKDHYSSLQIDKSDDLEIILFASRLKSQLVIYLYNIKKNAWDSVPNYSLNPKWSNEPVLNAKEYSQNLRLTRIKDDPDNKFLISLQGPRTVDFILYFPFINFCTTLYSLDTSAIHQHYDPANLIDAYKNGKYIKILHGHDLSDTWLEETLTVKDLNIYKFFSSSISILKHSKNLHDLYEKLKYLHQYDLELRFPEKNLESLIQDFINQSDLLKFPLSKAEVDKIALDYNAILSFSNEYKGLSIETLGHQAKILGKNLAHNPENSLRLLSLIRLAIRLNFGILPYNTQIFSVLAILNVPDKYKGRIAQVRTGEGKSTLTTILTTFLACQGRIVDVITSNSYLAKRDHLKYQNFYHYFGISSSYINHEDFKPQDFDAQVLFGTNVDFEFSLLFDAIYNKNLRYTTINSEKNKRPFDVVIVDEVDNLFIDTALNSARIANPSSKDYSWAYYPLWQLFLENPLLFSNVPPQILKAYLASYQNGKFSNQVEEFSEQQLKDWQDSARNAYRYTLDKDYVLINSEEDPNKKEIVIVDPDNTGRLMRGSRWSNGLHEFVEVKHGLFPEVESNTVAALSHPAFFNLYKNVYGLTGTMGEDIERSEIAEIYNVSSFDVPSHKSCLRKPINSKLLENDNLQAESLIQSIKFEQSKGRPVLVICSTIDDSCRISNILNNSSIKHLLLNEKQQEDEEYIIAKAGESKQVTIATNMAGRGTDIILSSESRDAGGLHVIFTFYPKNIRVQEQGYGRAGRQGQPGTCQMILCMNDPFITRLVRNNKLLDLHKEEDFLETLHSCRSKMVLEDSERRKTASKQETAIYKIALERFFIGLENIRIRLLEMDCEKLKAVLLNKPTIETNTKSFLESDHPKMKEVKSLLTNMLYRLDDLHESELRNIQNYYIELLLDRWAIWFDEQTHHRYRNLSLDEYLKHIQYEFNQLLSDGLDFAIQNPIKSFTSWLQRTIHAQEKNDSDTETSSHFAKMGP
ncbi:MAG: helicase-related protein [Gammaproteobacteria bacterium]